MRCMLLSTLSLSVLLACAPPAEEPPAAPAVDTLAVEQGVADLWNRVVFADTSGDAATMVGLYAETARIDVRGFPPILGRAAIDSTLRAVFAQYDYTDMRVMPSTTVVLSNELAYQDGAFLETYTQRGKAPMTDHGRYATAVAKGADGQWRFAYFIGFVDSTVAKR